MLSGWTMQQCSRYLADITVSQRLQMLQRFHRFTPGNRSLTRHELQVLFDHADNEVLAIRGRGRKGWLPAFRDATLLKVLFAGACAGARA